MLFCSYILHGEELGGISAMMVDGDDGDGDGG